MPAEGFEFDLPMFDEAAAKTMAEWYVEALQSQDVGDCQAWLALYRKLSYRERDMVDWRIYDILD